MQNKFGKLPLLTSGALLVFILLFVPLFTIVGAVTAPFHMVSDMIRNIGDFLVPDDSYTNDVFVVIDQYFKYGQGYELLASDYKHIIVDHEDLIYVPDNYLLIPNILIGEEHPGDHLIEEEHEFAYDSWIEKKYLYDKDGEPVINEETGEQEYEEVEVAELVSVSEYARRLKNIEPYASRLDMISSATLANYISHFDYIAGKPGLDFDLLDIDSEGWIYPFTRHFNITAGIGPYDPFGTGEYSMHEANDFGAGCGEAIYCVKGGTVIGKGTSTNSATGYSVTILTDDGYAVLYAHMSTPYVGNIGDYVKTGAYIGPVGTTGRSTGCHLHLKVTKDSSVVDYCGIVDCYN